MVPFSIDAIPMVVFILLLTATNVCSYNLLCDTTIPWLPVSASSSDLYSFNHTACNVKVSASFTHSYDRRTINVTSIFTNPANYPLNFTINGNAVGGEAQFAITFKINGVGYYQKMQQTSGSLQISYVWLSSTSTNFNLYLNGLLEDSPQIQGYRASDIAQIGFNVHTDYIWGPDNFVIFDYAAFNALNPTQSPTTKYPSLNPSVSPTISTAEPTHYPTTLFSTKYPTKLPTIYPTKATVKASSVRPTTYPTQKHLECDEQNGVILSISFDYELTNNDVGITGNVIDNDLLNVTDDLIDNKNSSLTYCSISDYVIYIDSNINTKRAVINISLCTTCHDIDEIEEHLVIDLIDLTNNNAILSVITDSINMDIDIIPISKNEAEQKHSTTELIIYTTDSKNKDENGSFYVIMSIIVSILCICILSISAYTLYMIRRDKKIKRQNTMELRIAANPGIKQFNTNPVIPVLVPTQSSVRSSCHSSVDGTAVHINTAKTDDDEHSQHSNDENIHNMINIEMNIKKHIDDITNNEIYIRKSMDDMNKEMIKIKSWLETVVGFPQYLDNFIQNGYERMDVIMAITDKSELEEIGINLIGHRTKIMVEIKKLQYNMDDNVNKQTEGEDVTVYDDNTNRKIL